MVKGEKGGEGRGFTIKHTAIEDLKDEKHSYSSLQCTLICRRYEICYQRRFDN